MADKEKVSDGVFWLLCVLCTPLMAEEFNEAAVGVYQDPGYGLERSMAADTQVDTVDPFTGSLKIQVADLKIPGNGGLDINVIRTYHSVTNYSGPYSNGHTARTPFGTGWDMHFGRIWVAKKYSSLNAGSNNTICRIGQVASNLNPVLELPGGSRKVLVNGDDPAYAFITKDRWIGRCLPTSQNNGFGGLVVISPEGVRYTFNVKGTVSPDYQLLTYFVSRIEDPSGNKLDFEYNIPSNNIYGRHHLLTRISASDGRDVKFTYTDEDGMRPSLASVSGAGKSISYSYIDAAYNVGAKAHYLSRVSYSDGTSWEYTYNDSATLVGDGPGRFSLQSMTSPLGLKTTYAYQLKQMGTDAAEKLNVVVKRTQGNVSSSTDESHTWLYSYVKGYSPNNDVTTVRGPANCIRYEHVGSNTISNGPSGVDRGLWKVGILEKKEVMGSDCGSVLRQERYSWDSQNVAQQNEMRRHSLVVENYTRAPVLSELEITQDGTTYVNTYTYDEYGRVQTHSESGQRSRSTTYGYESPGADWMLHKVSSKNLSGIGETSYSYTPEGKLGARTEYGVPTTYAYDSSGNLSVITDANQYKTRFEDYYRGVPRRVVYPDGTTLTRTVNQSGTVASVRDAEGRQTTYTYDDGDRVKSIIPPKGAAAQTVISYSFGNGMTELRKKGVVQSVRQYNQLAQLTSETESGGGLSLASATRYYPDGNPAFVSYRGNGTPPAQGINYVYDPLGRQTSAMKSNGVGQTTNYLSGNRVSVVDERGFTTTSSFVAYGEPSSGFLARIVQPGERTTNIATDDLGRVHSVTQGGLSRGYTYNTKGFLTTETHPENGTTIYGHDKVGNVISKTTGGVSETYELDARYRLKAANYGSGASVINEYDLIGRLKAQRYGASRWTYSYDAHGNMEEEKLTLSDVNRSYTFRYAYNLLDAPVSMTYPSGLEVAYSPDALGRLTRVGNFATAINYHPDGQLKSLQYGNGRTFTSSQNPVLLRPVDRVVSGRGTPMDYRYGYDKAANVTSIMDAQNSVNNRAMTYDSLNRLVTAEGSWGSGSFKYNNRDDITQQSFPGRNMSYSYNGAGRLASVSGDVAASFSYDSRGNVTRGRGTYGYDQRGHMIWSCSLPSDSCSSDPENRFKYDGKGYRYLHEKTAGETLISVYGANGKILLEDRLGAGETQEYIYLGREILANSTKCSDIDTDSDGVADCQEKPYGLDSSDPADGRADWDEDGLSNAEELRLGTQLRNDDSDDDGVPDGWEVRYGLNPRDASDALEDADGDGISNLDSYLRGIPPIDIWPRVVPAINYLLQEP